MAKLGLIIGTSEYEDTRLSALRAPTEDVSDLSEVLQSHEIGNFDEITLHLDETWSVVHKSVARLFSRRETTDTLLLYFSGHGVRDEDGELYLAVRNTETDFLSGTAISASFISRMMDKCSSKRQVLILDCCHSGAFPEGAKAAGTGISVDTERAFKGTGEGYGRFVLTASDATQYAWEGKKILGEPENSVFTHFILEGLRTGKADVDLDGLVTLDELYNYVFSQVTRATTKQKPRKWVYTQQGSVIIAKNPHATVKAFELPADLQQMMDHAYPEARIIAVKKLNDQLRTGSKGAVFEALNALKRLKQDTDPKVSNAATEALAGYDRPEQRAIPGTSLSKEGATADRAMSPTRSAARPSDQGRHVLEADIPRSDLDPPREEHYRSVIGSLAEGSVIPFLGAGAGFVGDTLGGDWQSGDRLPMAPELSTYLARNFGCPDDFGPDLIRVSQFIADSRGTGPLYEALHQVFDKDYPPTAVHKFFAALPQTLRAKGYRPPGQIIISVTYDDLLERALRDAGESFDVISYIAIGPDTGKFRHRLPNGENRIINAPNSYLGLAPDARTTILKIHGSVDRENPEQDSFVINEEDFIKFMTRTDISHLLPIQVAARLRRSNFLFLGYSLRDWSVRVILQRIWGEQRLKYESWAVMLKPDEADLMFWRKRDVRIFNMPLQQYIENLKRHLEGSENSN